MGRKPSASGVRDGSKHLRQVVACRHHGCSKTFGRVDHLRRHERKHSSASPSLGRSSHDHVDAWSYQHASSSHMGSSTAEEDVASSSRHGQSAEAPSSSFIDEILEDPPAFDWDSFVASIVEPQISPVNLLFNEQAEPATDAGLWAHDDRDSGGPNFGQVDEGVRDHLLAAFPDTFGRRDTDELSVGALSAALTAYWERFDPQLPVIHRPSFDTHNSSVLRLAVMLAIGQYALAPRRSLLAPLVPIIRSRLLSELSPDMRLTDLQALLLCNVFDEWMSSTKAHYQAQCFSSTLAAILRRRSLLVRYDGPDLHERERPEDQWRAWIEDESSIRLAYGLMLVDTQLSAFWGQVSSRRHSPLLLHLRLPEAPHVWAAGDVASWQLALASEPHPYRQLDWTTTDKDFVPAVDVPYESSKVFPGYSAALKAVLDGKGDVIDCKPVWNRLLLLHGLNMLVWDIRLHGSVSLIGRVSFSWRQSLHYAMLKLDDTPSERIESAIVARHFRDSMTLSTISLFADITTIQILAGATSVGGCTIGDRQRSTARTKLAAWAHSTEGKAAAYHAATYLQDTYTSNLFSEPTLVAPWAVYLCTLVCWTVASLHRPVVKVTNRPPQQLAIPRALSYLARTAEDPFAQRDDGEANVGLYCVLAAAHFFLEEKAGSWGIGVEAAKVLVTLMEGML